VVGLLAFMALVRLLNIKDARALPACCAARSSWQLTVELAIDNRHLSQN
jgi:hypothetical protein